MRDADRLLEAAAAAFAYSLQCFACRASAERHVDMEDLVSLREVRGAEPRVWAGGDALAQPRQRFANVRRLDSAKQVIGVAVLSYRYQARDRLGDDMPMRG